MKENKNEKLRDNVEKKSDKCNDSIIALTTTVMNLPNGKNVMPLREFEDMFTDKAKDEFLMVLSLDGEGILNDEMSEKTVIKITNTITLSGTIETVQEARAAI